MSDDIFRIQLESGQLEKALDALASPQFLRPALADVGRQATAHLKDYPPTREGQTYERTGTLGRKWAFTTAVNLFSVSAYIGNNTPYARAVQDEEVQAFIHQGRWLTVQDELKVAGEYAPAIVKDALEAEIRRLFGPLE